MSARFVIMLAPIPLVPVINLSAVFSAPSAGSGFQLITGAIGAVVNIALDLVLIPHAAIGAAFANSGGQLVRVCRSSSTPAGRSATCDGSSGARASVLSSAGAGLSGWLEPSWSAE